jgi:hypothetical protein
MGDNNPVGDFTKSYDERTKIRVIRNKEKYSK